MDCWMSSSEISWQEGVDGSDLSVLNWSSRIKRTDVHIDSWWVCARASVFACPNVQFYVCHVLWVLFKFVLLTFLIYTHAKVCRIFKYGRVDRRREKCESVCLLVKWDSLVYSNLSSLFFCISFVRVRYIIIRVGIDDIRVEASRCDRTLI